MTSPNRCPTAQLWRSLAAKWAGGLTLLVALGVHAGAASSLARASATVVEAVQVNGLLGTPVSVQDIVNALNAPAGPATGGPPIHLPSVLPFGLAEFDAVDGPHDDAEEAGTLGEAAEWNFGAGLLQRGLVAAISAVRLSGSTDGTGQIIIVVGFN